MAVFREMKKATLKRQPLDGIPNNLYMHDIVPFIVLGGLLRDNNR